MTDDGQPGARDSNLPGGRGWTCACARHATRRRRCSGPWSPTWSWPSIGAVILLAYDWLAARDPSLPDIGVALTAIYVVVVLVVGSVLTYLWVELPTGAAGGREASLALGRAAGLLRGRAHRVPGAGGRDADRPTRPGLTDGSRRGPGVASRGVRDAPGGVAQRSERSAYIRLVPGSNPGSPTSSRRSGWS